MPRKIKGKGRQRRRWGRIAHPSSFIIKSALHKIKHVFMTPLL
jgi:hypothetical protein